MVHVDVRHPISLVRPSRSSGAITSVESIIVCAWTDPVIVVDVRYGEVWVGDYSACCEDVFLGRLMVAFQFPIERGSGRLGYIGGNVVWKWASIDCSRCCERCDKGLGENELAFMKTYSFLLTYFDEHHVGAVE